MSRFDYVKYDETAVQLQESAKRMVSDLEAMIDQIGNCGFRSKSLAITKLEESYMWIGKAIRDDQIARNGSADLQEERKDG